MGTIFKKEFRRTRKGLLIWSIIVGIIVVFGILEYPTIGQYSSLVEEALAAIPSIGQIAFGVYNADLSQPIGYYIVMYYWIGLVVFVHATYIGASIIAKESRDKTAEFLFTKPYKRSTIVWAKVLAALCNIAVIFVVATAMSLVSMLPITSDISVYVQILSTCVGMFFTQCVLMSLGLALSSLFKTYRLGIWAAIVVLIACYCLMFSVQYLNMPSLNFLSPLTYFGVADVVANGLSPFYIGLSAVVIALCLFITQRMYRKKAMAV
jgi:ABC-2 type transport system permease protein